MTYQIDNGAGNILAAVAPASGRAAITAIALATALTHLALAGRYDFFRNELYFIICGRHPDFGYVDQPPLVPLLAAATQAFGENLWLLRLPAALAAASLVSLTGALARVLGGGGVAVVLAGVAAAIAPALMGVTTTLTTETLEPLAWTSTAYFLARGALKDDRGALIWAGLSAGLGMEIKYGMAIWLIGLALGVALFARKLFATRALWIGVLIATLLAAPSLVWQAVHGWPFFEVIGTHNSTHSIFTGTPLSFALQQVFALNLILAPLWIAGVIAPFASKSLAGARFLSLAFVVAALIVFFGNGKDYYLFPAYPTLFAVGSVACAPLSKWIRWPWIALAIAQSLLLAPIVLPILNPPALARFIDRTRLRPTPDEAAAIGAPLTQVFSDELGWRALEKSVAAVYRSLTPEEQAHVAIIGSNYGEAAAIDFFGATDNLPPALGGQNQYWLWGPRGHDGSVIIHVNGSEETWRRACQSLSVAATFGVPLAMPYENDRPIFLCRGMRVPLQQAWPRFKRYR